MQNYHRLAKCLLNAVLATALVMLALPVLALCGQIVIVFARATLGSTLVPIVVALFSTFAGISVVAARRASRSHRAARSAERRAAPMRLGRIGAIRTRRAVA
ncbi:MAG: hypothetical protein JSR77_18165 [Planctomycetes bacterium]|nr:hypothetical protein [Planctomycetota bacterium]